MSVFVSQVLISFIIECRGIPKLKIVLASDYAPPTPPSHPKSVQLYTYQKLQQRYHIDQGGGEFRRPQTAACATSAGTMAG